MNIGLDYDGTYTRDPRLWLRFVREAMRSGHRVYVVTMRYPSEQDSPDNPMDPALLRAVWSTNFTCRKAKVPYMKKLGVHIDVWVDDQPRALIMDAAEAFGSPCTPEGHVHDPAKDDPLPQSIAQGG